MPRTDAPVGFLPFAAGPRTELKSQPLALGDMASIATTPITIQAAQSGKLIIPISFTLIQQLAADTLVQNPFLRVGYTGKIGQQFNDLQASNAANRFFVQNAISLSSNWGVGVDPRGLALILWGTLDATYTGGAHGTFSAIVSYFLVP